MQPDNQFQPQNPIQPSPPTPPQPTPPAPAAPAAPAMPTIQPSSYQPATPPQPTTPPVAPAPAPAAPVMPTPAPQMTMTQPTPGPTPTMGGVSGGSMPPPNQPNFQSASSAGSSSASLGVAALITAVLVPFVGFILGIVSLVKGMKSQNKKLKLFGGISVVLSIVMMVLYAFVILPAASALLGSNYSKTQTIDATGGGYSFKITAPAAFEKDTSSTDSKPANAYVKADPKVNYYIYKDKKQKKGQVAVFTYQITDMSSLAALAKAYGQELNADSIIKDVLKDEEGLKKDLTTDKTIASVIKNLKVLSIAQDGNGILIKLSGDGVTKDGSTTEVVGEMGIYISDDFHMINTVVVAKKAPWDKNTDAFEGINKSISDQVNGTSTN